MKLLPTFLCLAGAATAVQAYLPSPVTMAAAGNGAAGKRAAVSSSTTDRRSLVGKGLIWGGAAAGLLAGAAVGPVAPARADVPEEGIVAPDFKLPSSLGKELSLADLRKSGKYTVLYFFPQVGASSSCVSAV